MKHRKQKKSSLSASAVFNDERVALAATAHFEARLRRKGRPHASGVSCEKIQNGHAVRVFPMLAGDLRALQGFGPTILHLWVEK